MKKKSFGIVCNSPLMPPCLRMHRFQRLVTPGPLGVLEDQVGQVCTWHCPLHPARSMAVQVGLGDQVGLDLVGPLAREYLGVLFLLYLVGLGVPETHDKQVTTKMRGSFQVTVTQKLRFSSVLSVVNHKSRFHGTQRSKCPENMYCW